MSDKKEKIEKSEKKEKKEKREIYLDNAATTKVKKEYAKIAYDVMTENYGNPSSIHKKGFEAEQILKGARADIAEVISCDPKEIIFTSGATEGNNLAILGGAWANKRVGAHIITTTMEHSSVMNTMKYLEEIGYDVTYLPCDENGLLRVDLLANAIESDTVLVSVMAVNNETGTIQPIEEVGNILARKNERCLFHVDGTQAAGKLPFNIKRTRIDLITGSGHKFHAPKGVGYLYKKGNIKLTQRVYGGGHEMGLRSGTENLPGIAAMAAALKDGDKNAQKNFEKVSKLRTAFVEGVLAMDDTRINGFVEEGPYTSPYICNASFLGVRGEVLIHALEDVGIYAATGSACSVHAKVKHGALYAMGLDSETIDSAVRFSFSDETTKDEIKETLSALNEIVPKLRKFTRR